MPEARHHVRREAGFTIPEVLVAAFILVIGIGAVITTMAVPTKETRTAQREAQAGMIAERQLESIVRLGKNVTTWTKIAPDVALTHQSDPTPNDPTDPRYFITSTNTGFAIDHDYHNAALGPVSGSPSTETLVAPLSGGIPAMTRTTAGDPPGTVYTFITYRNEMCSLQLPGNVLTPALNQIGNLVNSLLGAVTGLVNGLLGSDVLNGTANVFCGARNEAKRITVAVALDQPGAGVGVTKPVYMSAIIPNPNTGILATGGTFQRTCNIPLLGLLASCS